MREVKIKSINRKTSVSKALIKKAAEVAYGLRPASAKAAAHIKNSAKKHNKAA